MEVLIVDDEKDIVEAIEYNLKKEGFKVSKAFDGYNGLLLAKKNLPSIILLDLMLPGVPGLDVCRELKKEARTKDIPIIMLTAKASEADKVVGLELGADDYITKPFSMRELIARIRTILKRSGQKEEQNKNIVLSSHGIEIDTDSHSVKVLGKNVDLTVKEFDLLKRLLQNQGKVLTREKLLDSVWGITTYIETRTVDVHMKRLREKIGKAGKHIKTVRGVGYKFDV